MMKAEIKDRDLGKARGVNITLPEAVSWHRIYNGAFGGGNGIRLEALSRAQVRELGEALIEATRQQAFELGLTEDPAEAKDGDREPFCMMCGARGIGKIGTIVKGGDHDTVQ